MSFGLDVTANRALANTLMGRCRGIDYFDFPVNALAFAQSLRGSYLEEHRGVFFRRTKKTATVIHWDTDNAELLKVLREYKSKGIAVKSLNWLHRSSEGLPTKRYMNEYWCENISPDQFLQCSPRHTRRDIRHGLKRMEVDADPPKEEVMEVFDDWAAWAGERIFMVVTGHYRRFIQLHYEGVGDTYMFLLRDVKTGDAVAVGGGEFFRLKAVNVLLKHRHPPKHLHCVPRYGRYAAHKIAYDSGSSLIFFDGSTADKIKNRLPYEKGMSWKIDINAL